MAIPDSLCIYQSGFTEGESPAAVVPCRDVKLDLHDLGLIRAYGVFDYLRTYNQQPFRLPDYLNRFERSAGLLGMPLPIDKEKLSELVFELVGRTASALNDSRADFGLRFLLTGGPSPDGFTRSASPTLLVLIESATNPNPQDIELGVKLISCEYLRDLPEAKTTNYLNAIRLYPAMKAAGAAELLYCSQGLVLEASRANIFAFFGDTLVTPESSILLGNTRKSVLELAASKFEIQQRPITKEELKSADELFVTGSGRMLTPVVTVDTHQVGGGRPGRRTLQLVRDFEAFTGYRPTH